MPALDLGDGEREKTVGREGVLTISFAVCVGVSEFRQDYLGKHTIPSHPLATYVLTRQDTTILSEGDGDKIVRNERKSFSSSRFNSLPFNVIGS